jgi:trimeric autotransporter adhesin
LEKVQVLGITTGANNVAMGGATLSATTTASNNTAVGFSALCANTTGGDNTALGHYAGCQVTAGGNNTLLGKNAGTSTSPFTVTDATTNHRVVIGNNDVSNAYIKVAWTVTSDLRDKTEIENVPHGLAFVDKLKPVSFKFKKSRENDTPHGTKHYGFLAQDILELEGSDNVIIDDEQPDHLKYKGEHLVPVLVNAIKELKAEIELLKNK